MATKKKKAIAPKRAKRTAKVEHMSRRERRHARRGRYQAN